MGRWGCSHLIALFNKGLGSRHESEFSVWFFNYYKSINPAGWISGQAPWYPSQTYLLNPFLIQASKWGVFSKRSYYRGNIITDFNMVSIFESYVFFKTIRKLRQICSLLTFMAKVHFVSFRFSLVANSRIGADFEWTTIIETSKWPFLCFKVSIFQVHEFYIYYMQITLCSLDRD